MEQFTAVLRGRWKAALTTLLVVVATVVSVSLLLPRQYTATATLLMDFKSPDPIAGTSSAQPIASMMANEANVIQSERVMLQALAATRLLDSPEWRQKWVDKTDGQGEFQEWLAARFAKDLDVKLARDATMLSVLYTSHDREFAAAMTNAIVRAYLDTTLSLRVEPARQYSKFFDERARSAREALEAAQQRLSAFQQTTGIIGNDGKLELDSARLAQLSSQWVAMQSAAVESATREREAGRQIENVPERLANPVNAELNAALAAQKVKLIELESRLGERHPQVIELKAAIEQTTARIRIEDQRVVRGLGITKDVNRARVAQVTAAIDTERARLLKLKGQRDEAAVLQRDVEAAQKSYDAILARVNQSDLESQLKQTNVSWLKKASVPSKASSPKLLVNGAVSLVLGALLAVGVVGLRERFDRRVRSAHDVTEVLKLPMLGVLPGPTGPAVPGTRQRVLGLVQ